MDLQAAVLTIRSGKFGKSRLVPLHGSTCEVLTDYITRRNRFAAGRSISSYLLVSSRGRRLDDRVVHETFDVVARQIGLRRPSNSPNPRLHDFRHSSGTEIIPSTDDQRGPLREDHAIADASMAA